VGWELPKLSIPDFMSLHRRNPNHPGIIEIYAKKEAIDITSIAGSGNLSRTNRMTTSRKRSNDVPAIARGMTRMAMGMR
jgi:hypothetical protein